MMELWPVKLPEGINDVCFIPPLVLAYIGDAVFELYVRTKLLGEGELKVSSLHHRAVEYVKAKGQADFLHRLEDMLTPEEKDIVRRGRNAKSVTVPKNAEVADYRLATGFEALIGYLFLKGETLRLSEILARLDT